MGVVEDVVSHLMWGAANQLPIHYTQGPGRMSDLHCVRCLPLYADCSSWGTKVYCWAGAPDPNGRGYDGFGYTGTILQNCPLLPSVRALSLGDPFVFGPGMGDHVSWVVDYAGTDDPLLCSHGFEGGPLLVRLSQQMRQHRPPYRPLDGVNPAPGAPPAVPYVPEEILNAIVSDPVDGEVYEFDLRKDGTIGIKNIKENAWSTVAGFDWQKYGRPISIFASSRVHDDASKGLIDLGVKTDRGVLLKCGKPHGQSTFTPWYN